MIFAIGIVSYRRGKVVTTCKIYSVTNHLISVVTICKRL